MTMPKPMNAVPLDQFAQLRANEEEWDRRASGVQGKAAQAYARLIEIAETSDTGQARRVASFVASTFNGAAFRFDLFDLRALDVDISDDMLICLDALRWARADLYRLVPNGDKRIQRVIALWNMTASKPA